MKEIRQDKGGLSVYSDMDVSVLREWPYNLAQLLDVV